MGSEKTLLWGICVALMLFISVSMVDYFVVLHLKSDFDRVCQGYFWLCDQNVGLLESEVTALKQDLDKKGFSDITVTSPIKGRVSRGAQIQFSVVAKKDVSLKKTLFQKETHTQEFKYHQKTVSRLVVN